MILFPDKAKLYKIYYHKQNEYSFKILFDETGSNDQSDSKLEDILQNIKGLYDNKNNIEKQMNILLKDISEYQTYYLVNEKWIEEYKDLYNYNIIVKNIDKKEQQLKSYLKKQKISDFLKVEDNLRPNDIRDKFSKKYEIPIDFELIEKKLFDLIIENFNDNNNLKLKSQYEYQILFGDHKIFVKDQYNNNTIYFIYTLDKENYDLEYIIEYKGEGDIKGLLLNCKTSENFEELISNYDIDLSITSNQKIFDKNKRHIADIINIKAKDNIKKKDPNHCLGLENIGATCYMNATIQCLCHVLNVKEYFQNTQLVNNDTKNRNCRLTMEFCKLLNNLWKEPTKYKKYYTPTDFKNCISQMNPLFKGIAANDSKDLIIFIYETIHNEINKINQYNINYNLPIDLANFRNNYYSNNSSFLINTFYFEQQSELECLLCRFNKISYNITNILIFPLEKVREYMIKKSPNGFLSVTLDNCFENYQETEILTGQNQIYCNNCNQMANAKTGNKMFTSPEVMTIILNRGKGLEFDVIFEYPLFIDIDKYVMDKSNVNNKYELICVLTHLGPSGMAGHFIAFCKSPVNNKWYCYNDADVSEIDDPKNYRQEQIEGIPYVLFYQRCKSHNNKNKITLYVNYNEKQFFVDVDKNMKFSQLINLLNLKYKLPKNINLILSDQNNFISFENDKTINDYALENETLISAIEI